MSFNKTKAMRNAERYLTQGKISAAISEYKQVVENDPSDINSRNMLGDLYTKANDTQAAVNCYQEVAEHYNSQGFSKKAIAIYTKIYRIDQSSIEVALQLAELYQARGSHAEARNLYRDIAKRYEEKGRKIEALSIWEKIAVIAPKDTEIYLKIAEAYWQSDRREESAKAYVEAGNRLAEMEKHESAVTAFSRSLEVNADDENAIKGYVKSQLILGFPEDAATSLENKLEKDQFNKELNYLLMDCYFEMGRPEQAESLIIKLVEREPANYEKLLELTKVYLENDNLDSAVRVLSMTSEHLLVGGETETLLEFINEVLARNPEHITALRLLARYHGWQKDEYELKQTLERLAESANLTGDIDEERFALSQYVLLVPHDIDRSNRLKEINQEHGYEDSNDHQLLKSDSDEIPTFESFATLNNDEDNIDSSGFEILEESDVIEHNVEAEDQAEGHNNQYEELAETDETAETFEEKSTNDALSATDEVKIDEEIESIKFYIDQGYTGLAEKSLSELEKEFGNRKEFIELREQLPSSNADDQNVADDLDETSTALNSELNNETNSVESELIDNEEVVQADAATIEQEVLEDVEQTAENVTDELIESENNEIDEDLIDESDAGNELNVVEPEQENEPFDDSSETSVHTNSFDDFKDELGLDVDTEEIEQDNYEEHYQHAVVYQEMGMLEEAIREFQDAVNCIEPNDGTRRFLNCCTLIGHCFIQKEMPNLALSWFERSFETSDLEEKETLGIYYEIANAYEANNEQEKALDQFEKIYSLDVDYRDIVERLEKLREESALLV